MQRFGNYINAAPQLLDKCNWGADLSSNWGAD